MSLSDRKRQGYPWTPARLTVELAWKSSKIEGNTYTLLDTERLLKENISAKGKTAEETQMVINHKAEVTEKNQAL